jgi:uncharacterized membrane protein
MKISLRHVKKFIIRGIIALIPLGLSILAIRLLYTGIDQRMMRYLERFTGIRIPGLGIVVLLLALYLVGLIASNMVGRQIFTVIERITRQIPLVNTIYQVGKQLSTTISLPEKQVFKKAVLVEFLKPGMWTVGFVTGKIWDQPGNIELLKVYIPTPPNPTSGTIVLVKESQTRDTGWTIEETMKLVISAGIIGPTEILVKSERDI